MDDLSRQDARTHTLSVEQVAELYASAGHPRTLRSLQRYCKNDTLDAIKTQTGFGDSYLVAPYSVERHLKQIEEIITATNRDKSRPDRVSSAARNADETHQPSLITIDDPSRPVAAGVTEHINDDRQNSFATNTDMSRYVARVESENEFLRQQISVKDSQIKELTERSRETNVLIGGLQKMLTPLLGRPADERGPGDTPLARG